MGGEDESLAENASKPLSRMQAQNKALLEEIEIKNKTIKLLLVSGHLDEERLRQATELAGL